MIGAYLGGEQAPVCTLERQTGSHDRHGQPLLAAPLSVEARVQYRRHQVRNAQGEMVQCDALAFVPASLPVAIGDVFNVDGTAWSVITHERCAGFRPSHQELHLGGLGDNGTSSSR